MRQLDAKHGALESVEPGIKADVFVMILFLSAVNAQGGQFFRQSIVVRRQKTAVTHSAEIFGRIETETSDRAHRARSHSAFFGTDRLGGVFDERNAVPFA